MASEAPTAEAVAKAVVASAKVLQEDPLAIAGVVGLRCRFPALQALRIIYPGLSWDAAGRMVGITDPRTAQPRLTSAFKASWWPTLGGLAVEAALEALETL